MANRLTLENKSHLTVIFRFRSKLITIKIRRQTIAANVDTIPICFSLIAAQKLESEALRSSQASPL